jgi:hypothetical protein
MRRGINLSVAITYESLDDGLINSINTRIKAIRLIDILTMFISYCLLAFNEKKHAIDSTLAMIINEYDTLSYSLKVVYSKIYPTNTIKPLMITFTLYFSSRFRTYTP